MSAAQGSPSDGAAPEGTHAAPYDPNRRVPRAHRRVSVRGTERFDADGVKREAADELTSAQRAAEDDRRILSELPPHWGVFEERG
ncbi:MAG: hypothetical protein UHD09_04440 [Bifidobacterium sp.]|nr:hypothetical protein [Bifidobacterium sp.]